MFRLNALPFLIALLLIPSCKQQSPNQSCEKKSQVNTSKTGDTKRKNSSLIKTGKTSQKTPEWLAQAQVEAYNARDIDKFVSYYAKDVKIYRFPSGKLMMSGRETMRKSYKKYFEKSPNLNCRIIKRVVNSNFVIDNELVTGGRGKKEEVRATAIYEIQKGFIQNVWFLPTY